MINDKMEKIISLAKRRGFIFPGSEIYGGLSNSYDYGPLGVELKNNISRLWWKKFVQQRDDMVGLDAALIMNSRVWEASGHVKNFSDPLVECKKCHERFRTDNTDIESPCENCGEKGQFTKPKQFNLMMQTHIGSVNPIESLQIYEAGVVSKVKEVWKVGKERDRERKEKQDIAKKAIQDYMDSIVYFRPEIAQAMFINFKNVLDTTRKKLPFGIASQGKAFRNEITPGNFIFRTREFDLMEFEYFVQETEWEKWFEYWQNEMREWLKELGVDPQKVHEVEIPDGERAHYSKRTVDFEYDYPFGQKELYGLAYRTDFDLRNHFKEPPYRDPDTGEEFWPHVIEPTFGLDRSVLVTLLEAYDEEKDPSTKLGASRVVLKLPLKLAPYKAAVFPLLANKPELVKLARNIYDALRKDFMVAFDGRGNIGKRYYSQDEIGTPFCVTVDFDSLEKNDATVRERDTMKQERINIAEIKAYLDKKISES